jgi:hypothetical protein
LDKSIDIIDVIEAKLKPDIKRSRSRSMSKQKDVVPAILDTLHAIDNDYNLLNSPANIKMSSIVIEQQQSALHPRYDLRQRNSPFVSRINPDAHLLRNSTPVHMVEKKKLNLDESIEKKSLFVENCNVEKRWRMKFFMFLFGFLAVFLFLNFDEKIIIETFNFVKNFLKSNVNFFK